MSFQLHLVLKNHMFLFLFVFNVSLAKTYKWQFQTFFHVKNSMRCLLYKNKIRNFDPICTKKFLALHNYLLKVPPIRFFSISIIDFEEMMIFSKIVKFLRVPMRPLYPQNEICNYAWKILQNLVDDLLIIYFLPTFHFWS